MRSLLPSARCLGEAGGYPVPSATSTATADRVLQVCAPAAQRRGASTKSRQRTAITTGPLPFFGGGVGLLGWTAADFDHTCGSPWGAASAADGPRRSQRVDAEGIPHRKARPPGSTRVGNAAPGGTIMRKTPAFSRNSGTIPRSAISGAVWHAIPPAERLAARKRHARSPISAPTDKIVGT